MKFAPPFYAPLFNLKTKGGILSKFLLLQKRWMDTTHERSSRQFKAQITD